MDTPTAVTAPEVNARAASTVGVNLTLAGQRFWLTDVAAEVLISQLASALVDALARLRYASVDVS
jgi:hypothetical protein